MTEIDLQPLKQALQGLPIHGRTALLPALHLAQSIYGHIPEAAAAEIGRIFDVPLADVSGVIEFYSMFSVDPKGDQVLRVCTDLACGLAGSDSVLATLCQHLGVSLGEVTQNGAFSVERVTCLGLCDHAPAVLAGENPIGKANPSHPEHICNGKVTGQQTFIGGDARLLTANCEHGLPQSLEQYLASAGYIGLQKALSLAPGQVINIVKESGLVGRGGAAFPTGLKLEGASSAMGEPKYVVCNADESEPGTFKDRVLMEGDPHRVIEGLIIAAFAIGSHHGYIFVRGEYPVAFQSMTQAVDQARQAGFIGKNILDSGFDFDVELRLGAGAYICGEETALFESIEGKRGFPRIKPPFPTTHGLFSCPTAVNNVETLSNLPYIVREGAQVYRQLGTAKSPGTKLFCVSGDIVQAGVYEVPFGITLRHLLFDLAGGTRTNLPIQAILLGGAAGSFATAKDLDVHLSFEDLREANLPLGSGVVMVFDASRDMRDVLARLGRFFAHESCGKCYPCQLGTQRQSDILERISRGNVLTGDPERLADIGATMADSSLCGLGQTAATAVLSAMRLWPGLFRV